MFKKKIDSRTIKGCPDFQLGTDTTYARMRMMAQDVRDNSYETKMERGMAVAILALIEDAERLFNGRT